MQLNDELKIYRGKDFVVSDHIVIHQPTLGEICDYGEEEYWRLVHHFTAVPQNLKWQLWDANIDYTEITPYELFISILYGAYPQEKTSIIFGDLDFTKFKIVKRSDDGSILLKQQVEVRHKKNQPEENLSLFRKIYKKIKELFVKPKPDDKSGEDEYVTYDEVLIDEFTYNLITDYLRNVHNIIKDEKIPGNESTKQILIEDAREEYLLNMNKEYHSQLKNLISAMINCEGFKYNHSQVWDMKINAFMDSVKRILKIKNSNLLLQSGYSGFGIDLKKIDDKQLDWIGELS